MQKNCVKPAWTLVRFAKDDHRLIGGMNCESQTLLNPKSLKRKPNKEPQGLDDFLRAHDALASLELMDRL